MNQEHSRMGIWRTAPAAAMAVWLAGCATTDPAAVHFQGAGANSNVFVAPGHAAVRKVAVMPFKAPTELIGVAVSDQVLTELLRTGRYDLLERGQMAQVLGEQELALSGLSAGKAAEIGAMMGADGVIIGTVSEYENVAQGGRTVPVVGVSARLIDAKSGRILWSADLSQKAPGASVTLSEHSRRVVHELIAGVFQKLGATP